MDDFWLLDARISIEATILAIRYIPGGVTVCAQKHENKPLWNIPLRVDEGEILICSLCLMESSTHSSKNKAMCL